MYRWNKTLESFVASMGMVSLDIQKGVVAIKKCSVIANVCHGQEGHESDFFYMYGCLFTDSHVRLHFHEFTMGVLSVLNLVSTQLHPNSWVYLQAF